MLARDITAQLGGHWYGRYGRCTCPVHNGSGESLQIRDKPTNRDGIDVVCFVGCDWKEIKAALARQRLIDGRPSQAHPVDDEALRRLAEQERHEREAQRRRAISVWRRSIRQTPSVARYLSARGIDLSRIGGIPKSLRFAGDCFHGLTKTRHPAMVAAIQDATGKLAAVHQTFLARDARAKAALENPKLILGACGGGAVRLFPIAPEIGVAEGVETALSATLLTGIPCWAVLSTSGMVGFMVPPMIERVVIFADYDPINPRTGKRPGTYAADTLAERLARQRIAAEIRYPPGGRKDFNDALCERAE